MFAHGWGRGVSFREKEKISLATTHQSNWAATVFTTNNCAVGNDVMYTCNKKPTGIGCVGRTATEET